MFKTIATILVTSVIALGGGTASVWYALHEVPGLDALHIGPWTAYPSAGTPSADPYSAARAARRADLPLGTSEGIVFTARRDAAGASLDRACSYHIEGVAPVARFFTLHAEDGNGQPIRGRMRRAIGLVSFDLLRLDKDSIAIEVSRDPEPGNWLAVEGSGSMALVLTLYDTPIASNERIGEIVLPELRRIGCAT